MNKKIIISLAIIGIVGAIAVGGTVAYFTDTETSTGNTFTAGTLDLKVDSECS
ncbi:MAG: TasA family protein [Candidatus Pacebacteria bacterium]|nr:TasA family protein [Candidatus Paceibacterota bacterium]